ncbi:hypothetical protein [Variovorax sp. E3]|uniref:hypothetical protein n=1 Tax=Variovorax sp. E3 TaxID=1914993 RepID=UPI0018DE79BC|nr:hypothetical protein [Variovorax sp. E3]
MNAVKIPTETILDGHIHAEVSKLMVQTLKLSTEQTKFNAESERAWIPMVAIMAAAGVGATLTVALSRLCHG